MAYLSTDQMMVWNQHEPKTGHPIWCIRFAPKLAKPNESHHSLEKIEKRLKQLKNQGWNIPESVFERITAEFEYPNPRHDGYRTRIEAKESRSKL